MAEDKKPKIDLKARLGKMGGQTAPPPVSSSPSGRPPPPATGSIPAPPMGTGLSAPPGIPIGPPAPFASQPSAIDPSNPLSAVATPYRAPTPPAPPPPQRIEVDESAVQEARAGARKQGITIGLIVAVLFAGVGYVAGGASETNAGRKRAVVDAGDLATQAAKAKETLNALSAKLEAGRDAIKGRKFPDTLAKDLGGLNVDFDGSVLAGRRFSGFPSTTTAQLVEFITSVQSVNDRKLVIINLLNKLQKPLTDQLNAPAGQQSIAQVIVVDKDPAGNPAAFLSTLATPILVTKEKLDLPVEFTFAKPGGGGNVTAPRYKSGDIATKAAALYVVPKTFEAVCPSETAGQLAQLSAQIGSFAREIKGEAAAAEGMDGKAGLSERADRLAEALRKVQ